MNFHSRSYSESATVNGVIRISPDSQESLDRLFNPLMRESTIPLRDRNLPSSFFNPNCSQANNTKQRIEPDSTSLSQSNPPTSTSQASSQQQAFSSYHQRNYSSPSFMPNGNPQHNRQLNTASTLLKNSPATRTHQLTTISSSGNVSEYNRSQPNHERNVEQFVGTTNIEATTVESHIVTNHQQNNLSQYNTGNTNHNDGPTRSIGCSQYQQSSCQQFKQAYNMTPGHIHEPVHSHSIHRNAQPQHHFRCQSMFVGSSNLSATSQNCSSNASTSSSYLSGGDSQTGSSLRSQGDMQKFVIASDAGAPPARIPHHHQAASHHQRNFSSPAITINNIAQNSHVQQFSNNTQIPDHNHNHSHQVQPMHVQSHNPHQNLFIPNQNPPQPQSHQHHQQVLNYENDATATQFEPQAQYQGSYTTQVGYAPAFTENTTRSNSTAFNDGYIDSSQTSQFIMPSEFIADSGPFPAKVTSHDTFQHGTCAPFSHNHVVH